jgi:hypothetical protein
LPASNFDSVWNELRESCHSHTYDGVILRRISPEVPFDFFLGIEQTTFRRLFLLRIDKKEATPFSLLPEFRGFEISRMTFPDEKPDKIFIGLSLNDNAYSDIFSALCEDLFQISIKQPDHKRMILSLKERLIQWKKFLEISGDQGMSSEFQRGLYGELRFLRDILFEIMDISDAINCWKGPSRKNQDFQIFGKGVEVKTSIAKQHQKIQIANELQLDDNNLECLYLYFLSLQETLNHGETLPKIIDDLRKIIEIGGGPVSEFEIQLFKSGYLDRHRDRYIKTGYHDRNIEIFRIEEDFPRIIESDLKPGIGDVHYSIDLAVCKRFRIKKENFIADIELTYNDC